MIRALFAAILFIFCAANSLAHNLSQSDANVYINMHQDDAARAYDSQISERFSEHIELAPSVKFSKQRYFVGELIALDISIKSSSKSEFSPQISLGTNTNMKLLKIEKFRFDGSSYHARAYLKALNANAKLSQLDVQLFRASSQIATAQLAIKSPKITPLPHERFFSGIVADELEFKDFKCTPYDDENIICSATLKAANCALEDFAPSHAKATNLSANNYDYEHNQAYAAMILPHSASELSFSYFRPSSEEFAQINEQIVVASEEVSTQSDLAPTSKELGFFVQIICLLLAILCLLVVLYFRRFFSLLALAVLFAAAGLYQSPSYQSATLAANSSISILPTQNATIFMHTGRDLRVKVLSSYGDFRKIELPDEKIGWVKSSLLR